MTVRSATRDDFPAMLEALRADEEQVFGRPSQITASDLREWTSRTKLDEDSWLIEQEGALCAVGWIDSLGELDRKSVV